MARSTWTGAGRARTLALLGSMLLGTYGCGRLWFEPQTDAGPDASLSDASLLDASLSDASLSDASLLDASLLDASLLDAPLLDAPDAVSPSCAGDFLVDSPEDDPGAELSCMGAGCSLRAAVARANTLSSATVCLAEGLSVSLATSVAVSGDVTIVGASAAICGTGADRVFRVVPGGALRLRDLRVCHGRSTDAPGAAVLVEPGATLDADRVVFDDNVVTSDATAQEGGAIFVSGDAAVELRQSRLTNNRVTAIGGQLARGGAFAIRTAGGTTGRVVITDTAFEDNAASSVGGAMYLAIDARNATLDRLLFARNQAPIGSAIDINCASLGTFVIASSTFADNGAGDSVIYVCRDSVVRLSFCSIGYNGGPLVRFGDARSGVEWEASAILAGAFDLCTGPGTSASLDHNVVDVSSTLCPLEAAGDRVLDPMLARLADNGGLTATLALVAGSPAVDGGGASCPAVDQRGVARPLGAACDVGAFELE